MNLQALQLSAMGLDVGAVQRMTRPKPNMARITEIVERNMRRGYEAGRLAVATVPAPRAVQARFAPKQPKPRKWSRNAWQMPKGGSACVRRIKAWIETAKPGDQCTGAMFGLTQFTTYNANRIFTQAAQAGKLRLYRAPRFRTGQKPTPFIYEKV